jgi:hypothetical protein
LKPSAHLFHGFLLALDLSIQSPFFHFFQQPANQLGRF